MGRIPEIWGVLNVTPDSFSDGGRYVDVESARSRVVELLLEGADVVDVGGESTRPGYEDVDVAEELRRISPAVQAAVEVGAVVSIDTTKLEVAERALDLGARIVNHVGEAISAEMLALVAARSASLVLMHTGGKGKVADPTVSPERLMREVRDVLLEGADRAREAGISASRIYLDPGLGFGKVAAQSAGMVQNLPVLVSTGYPIMVGASRKSFIAEISAEHDGGRPAPSERLGGSIGAALAAFRAGARALRVHDVKATRQALSVFAATTLGTSGEAA